MGYCGDGSLGAITNLQRAMAISPAAGRVARTFSRNTLALQPQSTSHPTIFSRTARTSPARPRPAWVAPPLPANGMNGNGNGNGVDPNEADAIRRRNAQDAADRAQREREARDREEEARRNAEAARQNADAEARARAEAESRARLDADAEARAIREAVERAAREERERLDAAAREERERADAEARDRRDIVVGGDWQGGGGGGTGGGAGGIPGDIWRPAGANGGAPEGSGSLILPAAAVAAILFLGGGF